MKEMKHKKSETYQKVEDDRGHRNEELQILPPTAEPHCRGVRT